MKNIAIMGSSGGAGKDTVADIITDITGIDYQKISLAQEIHRIYNKLSSNPQRNELQAVGESMRDIFGENVWMDLTDRTMHGPTIVPDIRKLLEYSHYVIERDFLPLYVYTDPEITRNRLKARDGSFNERDLKRNIETQMNFIQELPATRVGDCSLYKVNDSGIFNNIYIIDNSRSIEETRAARKGRDVLDANLSMRSYGKIGQLSGRLQKAKLRLASQGINIISVAQAADEMEDAGNGQRVKVGEKPNMDKRARFDYDVVIRLFTKDNKYYGEIEKDRLEVFERGDIVENPSYQNWAHRLESKDNQGEAVAKDFSKDAEKSQKAYYEEVKVEMSFADRVKEYFATIDADTKKKFIAMQLQ